MRLYPALVAAFASMMMTPVAFAADTSAPPAACGPMQSLTPEQRIMLFTEMHQQTASMTDDQRRDFHRQQRDKFVSMSEADRQKYMAGLQAKWDALPADQKTRLQQDAEQARSEHPMMARWSQNHGC